MKYIVANKNTVHNLVNRQLKDIQESHNRRQNLISAFRMNIIDREQFTNELQKLMKMTFLMLFILACNSCSSMSTAENVFKVAPGMSEEDAVAVMGEPESKYNGRWFYKVEAGNMWIQDQRVVIVQFKEGRVNALKVLDSGRPSTAERIQQFQNTTNQFVSSPVFNSQPIMPMVRCFQEPNGLGGFRTQCY